MRQSHAQLSASSSAPWLPLAATCVCVWRPATGDRRPATGDAAAAEFERLGDASGDNTESPDMDTSLGDAVD